MKRRTLHFVIDLLSFTNLVCLALTGLIMKYVLPPGSGGEGHGFRGGRGSEQIKQFLSMTRHKWGYIHFCLALLFVFLIVVHIALHWSWIKNNFKSLAGMSQEKNGV